MTDGTVSERLPFGNYWVDGLGHLFHVHCVSQIWGCWSGVTGSWNRGTERRFLIDFTFLPL
jgi:hypothetical protein